MNEYKPMRVLVCGDRNWTDMFLVWGALDYVYSQFFEIIIITGGARGADTHAETWANYNHVECKIYHAQWKKYGKAAGPIRNQKMIDKGKPDYALVFHDNLEKSKGTKDMVCRLKQANIEFDVIDHREDDME